MLRVNSVVPMNAVARQGRHPARTAPQNSMRSAAELPISQAQDPGVSPDTLAIRAALFRVAVLLASADVEYQRLLDALSASGRDFTVPQVAAILEESTSAVRRKLQKGKLKGTRSGSTWAIPVAEIAKFLAWVKVSGLHPGDLVLHPRIEAGLQDSLGATVVQSSR
jgi:Helix-turn-helix domain